MVELTFKDIKEDSLTVNFRNTDVSIVNGLRRTIMTEIPTLVFKGFPYNENEINIETNTTKFNNEYMKHRISCVPICNDDPTTFEQYVKNYVVELEEVNETLEKMYITTEHFKVKHKTTGEYLPREEVMKLFPPSNISGDYIILCILYPNYNKKNEETERIKFAANFNIGKAVDNSCWNVVNTCAYENVKDDKMIQTLLETTNMSDYEKKDFMLLDAQRVYIPNEFRFHLEGIGIYSSSKIMDIATSYIISKFRLIKENIHQQTKILSKEQAIFNETNGKLSLEEIETIENVYAQMYYDDNMIVIKIKKDDFTVGKILEKKLYHNYCENSNVLEFVGFKKEHPTKKEAFIYIKFMNNAKKNDIKQMIDQSCVEIIKDLEYIKENMK